MYNYSISKKHVNMIEIILARSNQLVIQLNSLASVPTPLGRTCINRRSVQNGHSTLYLHCIDRTVIGLVCSFESTSVIRLCNVYIQYIDRTVIGLVCSFERVSVIRVCNGNNVADEFAIFLVMCQCFCDTHASLFPQ